MNILFKESSRVIGCNADGSEGLLPKAVQRCSDDAEH